MASAAGAGGLACTRIMSKAGQGGVLPADHDEVKEALRKVRQDMALRKQGSVGNLALAFKRTDWNGNKKLDRQEFDDALRSVGVFLKSQQLSAVFRAFDSDSSGAVNYDEFLRGMKGDMNERRTAMVRRCFEYMDKDGSGQLTLADLKQYYTPSDAAVQKWLNEQRLEGTSAYAPASAAAPARASAGHFATTQQVMSAVKPPGSSPWDSARVGATPQVSGAPPGGEPHHSSTVKWASDVDLAATGASAVTGDMSREERSAHREQFLAQQAAKSSQEQQARDALTLDFLDNFEGARGNDDGVVTWEEFKDYYADMGSSIASDDLFVGILESAFMIVEAQSAQVDKAIQLVESRLRRKCEEKRQKGESAVHTCVRLMKYYDVDHSGYITATEFRKALADMGISVERRLIGEMMRRYDADSSGALDYLELARALFEFSQADLYMTTNQVA